MYHSIVYSCEHAGNEVPDQYCYLFETNREVLETHRGWDPGAWKLAKFLASRLNAPLLGCHTTRLLIEANRSPNSIELFSQFSNVLSVPEKENLVRTIYLPYRNKFQQILEAAAKPVLHLSIHSFTPIWNGVERSVDIGILFDPDQPIESAYCHLLKKELEKKLPNLKIKFNEPYKGTDDGFTTWLRKYSTPESYTGIELEVNQKFAPNLTLIQNQFAEAIQATLTSNGKF